MEKESHHFVFQVWLSVWVGNPLSDGYSEYIWGEAIGESWNVCWQCSHQQKCAGEYTNWASDPLFGVKIS